MPSHTILPSVPASLQQPDEKRKTQGLIIAAQPKLPDYPEGATGGAVLKWATEALRTPGLDAGTQRQIRDRVKQSLSPKAQPALWQSALNAAALPFDAFSEGIASLVGGLPLPMPAIFKERAAESRNVLGRIISGDISPAEAAGFLRENFQKRGGIEQVILGIIFDPLSLIPPVAAVKLGARVGRAGVPGAARLGKIAGAFVGPPIPRFKRPKRQTPEEAIARAIEVGVRGGIGSNEIRAIVGGSPTPEEVSDALITATRRQVLQPGDMERGIEGARSLAKGDVVGSAGDEALMRVWIDSLARGAELSRVNIEDIRFDRGKLVLRDAKGRKRSVPELGRLSDDTLIGLSRYVKARKAKPTDPLFVNSTGKNKGLRYTPNQINNFGKRAFAAGGVEGAHAKLIRRSKATELAKGAAEAGLSIRIVGQILGHASLDTTVKHYIELHPSQLTTEFSDVFDRLMREGGLPVGGDLAGIAKSIAKDIDKAKREAQGQVAAETRKGRKAGAAAFDKEALQEVGQSKIAQIVIDEDQLVNVPKALRPAARKVLQIIEAGGLLELGADVHAMLEGNTALISGKTAKAELKQMRAEQRALKGELDALAAGITADIAILVQTRTTTEGFTTLIGEANASLPNLINASRGIRAAEMATYIWTQMATSTSGRFRRPTRDIATTLKIGPEDSGGALIPIGFDELSVQKQREAVVKFMSHPGVRTLLARTMPLVETADDDIRFLVQGHNPKTTLLKIARQPKLAHLLGADFEFLSLELKGARIDLLVATMWAAETGGRKFLEPTAKIRAKFLGDQPRRVVDDVGDPLLGPEPFVTPGVLEMDKNGGLTGASVLKPASTVEFIAEHGSKPNKIAMWVIEKSMPSHASEGTRWRLARGAARALEIVGGRGVGANKAGQFMLGHTESIRQGESLTLIAFEQLRPLWRGLNLPEGEKSIADLYDEITNTFDLRVKKFDDDIVDELRRALGPREIPSALDEVMRHQITLLELIPINRLDEFYELTPAQKMAIVSLRNTVDEAAKMLTKRAPKWARHLKNKGAKGVLAYYFPRVRAGKERGRIRPGQYAQDAEWLKARHIENAVLAIRNNIPYKDPFAAAERFVRESYGLAADEELRRAMVKFSTANPKARSGLAIARNLELIRANIAADRGLKGIHPNIVASVQAAYPKTLDSLIKEGVAGAEASKGLIADTIKLARNKVQAAHDLRAAQPKVAAFNGFVFDEDTASIAKAWYEEGHENLLRLSKSLNSWTTLARLLRAGVDFSAMFIHGTLTFFRHPLIWFSAFGKMTRAMFDPRGAAQGLREGVVRRQLLRSPEFQKFGGLIGRAEPFEALAEGISGPAARVRQVPVVGKTFLARAESGFTIFLNEARLKMWEGMRHSAKNDAELFDLAAHVNKMTGGYNATLAGMPELQKYLESTFISFAPNYRRAAYGLIVDAMRSPGTLRGREAQKAIIALVSAGTAMAMLIKASGNNDKVGNPTSPRFMAARIPGSDVYVGFGTAYYSLVRLAANISKTAMEKPDNFLSLDPRDNPLLKFWRSQASPLSGTMTDFVIGSTYIGDPLRDRDGFLGMESVRHLAAQAVPFMLEDLFRGLAQGENIEAASIAGEATGLRSFPISLFERRGLLRDNLVNMDGNSELRAFRISKGGTTTWHDLPALLQRQLEQRHPDLKEINDEIDEKTRLTGRSLESDMAAYRLKIKENRKIVDEKLKGIAISFEQGFRTDGAAVTGKWFREQVRQQGAVLRALQDKTGDDFKHVIDEFDRLKLQNPKERSFIGDQLFDKYIEGVILNEKNTNVDNIFLPDVFKRNDTDFANKFGPEMYKYVRERLRVGRQIPDLVKEYLAAQQTLIPYWSAQDDLWAEDTWQHDMISNFLALTLRQQTVFAKLHPSVRQLSARLDKHRDRLRKTNPELDWLLVKFYDNSPRTDLAAERMEAFRPGPA